MLRGNKKEISSGIEIMSRCLEPLHSAFFSGSGGNLLPKPIGNVKNTYSGRSMGGLYRLVLDLICSGAKTVDDLGNFLEFSLWGKQMADIQMTKNSKNQIILQDELKKEAGKFLEILEKEKFILKTLPEKENSPANENNLNYFLNARQQNNISLQQSIYSPTDLGLATFQSSFAPPGKYLVYHIIF
jgi:hypothetical protein